jgi:hypothetical protein
MRPESRTAFLAPTGPPRRPSLITRHNPTTRAFPGTGLDPTPRMRLLQKGILSAVALLVVTCLLKTLPRVKNGLLPFSRILRLGSPRRNLKVSRGPEDACPAALAGDVAPYPEDHIDRRRWRRCTRG